MASVFGVGVKPIGSNLSLTRTAAAPALPDGSPTKCQYPAVTAAAEEPAFTDSSVLVPAHTENRHFFDRDFLKKLEVRVFENEFLDLFFPPSEIKFFDMWYILEGEFFENGSSNFFFSKYF